MNTIKLIAKLKKLKKDWYFIDTSSYDIWEDYWYNEIKRWVIKIIIKKDYIKHRIGLDNIFNNICYHITQKEDTIQPLIDELWYNDSIKWLSLYPYWYDDNSNCVLLNWHSRVLWVNYNWSSNTTYIISSWVINIPNYIVINDSKKLEWEYYRKDIANLFSNLNKYFNF